MIRLSNPLFEILSKALIYGFYYFNDLFAFKNLKEVKYG